MDVKDFDFDLPEKLIALYPTKKRDQSKLMIVDRKKENITIKKFINITDYFNENDLIIFNNSKVINARLRLKRDTGGKVEFLLLSHSDDFSQWKVLCNRTKKVNIGDVLHSEKGLKAKVVDKINNEFIIEFDEPMHYNLLNKYGEIPLPPYIANKRELVNSDYERYQTTYAKTSGSFASPTAGLHFTNDILEKLRKKGVKTAFITLHVSAGTFLPIKTDKVEEHNMHFETYEIDEENAELINNYVKDKNKRITCVGTTSIRTLESELFNNSIKQVSPGKKQTNLYIYPGYKFRACDRLITNFHTPRSTLILLVSAFAGTDIIKKAYKKAIDEEMRFYSYGDSMLIL